MAADVTAAAHGVRTREFADAREMDDFLATHHNWGRWGEDDWAGTVNLISPRHRAGAARLVRDGTAVPLGRRWPVAGRDPADGYTVELVARGGEAGSAKDVIRLDCHGTEYTHLDSLAHVWDLGGRLYNDRDPLAVMPPGTLPDGVGQWASGIVTRGVLLDIPRARDEPFVTLDRPVTGGELETVLARQGVPLSAGDAVAIRCGREEWDRSRPTWGSRPERPGMDPSCLTFLRAHDVAVLLWDMLDVRPLRFGRPHGVHAAIAAFGLAIVDNADLAGLSAACRSAGRWDFMLSVQPWPAGHTTGSLVNPIALF
jgi:kynurenine formamidase